MRMERVDGELDRLEVIEHAVKRSRSEIVQDEQLGEHGVVRIVVRLVDLNGPKGGVDKRCRIAAELSARVPGVLVEATDADAYVAVSQAAARLDERVTRALARRKGWPASTRAEVRRLRGRGPIETQANEANESR